MSCVYHYVWLSGLHLLMGQMLKKSVDGGDDAAKKLLDDLEGESSFGPFRRLSLMV